MRDDAKNDCFPDFTLLNFTALLLQLLHESGILRVDHHDIKNIKSEVDGDDDYDNNNINNNNLIIQYIFLDCSAGYLEFNCGYIFYVMLFIFT